MPEPQIQLSVAATPDSQSSWGSLARRCEDIGCRGLLVPDHPGTGPSPFVALAGAAASTSTLRLGSYVVNAGIRDPLLLAADVATLDVVSDGRAELGIGAGHTPAEWEMTGRSKRPRPPERVDRLVTVATAVRTLLGGGTVPAADLGVSSDVRLEEPRPVQDPVPILVGGGNRTLLGWAGGHADAVGLSGLARTLADGHRHTVDWSPGRTDEQVELVRAGARARNADVPALEALVQRVHETDDRAAVAKQIAAEVEAPVDEVLVAPYVLLGTVEQIVDQLHAARERWGITRWAVREDALGTTERVLARLHA